MQQSIGPTPRHSATAFAAGVVTPAAPSSSGFSGVNSDISENNRNNNSSSSSSDSQRNSLSGGGSGTARDLPFYLQQQHYNNNVYFGGGGTRRDSAGHLAAAEARPWPVPEGETMQSRWNFRDRIRRETNEHRRIILQQEHHQQQHNNNYGASTTGAAASSGAAVRNIVSILQDRERFGAQALTLGLRRRRCRQYRKGDVSPSTVFESPISTHGTVSAALEDAVQLPSSSGMILTSSSRDRDDHNPQDTSNSPEDDSEHLQHHLHTHHHLFPVTSLSSSASCAANNIHNKNEMEQQQQLTQRRVLFPMKIGQEVRFFGESYSATRYQSAFLHHLGGNLEPLDAHGQRPASSPAVSTISVAFSPDSHTLASTHGDHTVKISCCHTGRLLQSLEGHPRTPWTVKYHPTHSAIVASGCLGHQVRVWNWKVAQLLQMIRLEFAIISLSFHPSGSLLAIANGTRLHLWSVSLPSYINNETNSGSRNNNNNNTNSNPSSTTSAYSASPSNMLIELDQRHMLRCVHFPPNGNTLILGGVNPAPQEDARRARGAGGRGGIGASGMSFYLRLWDFDLDRATEGPVPGRRILTNPRTFVPRALLYNDGGFDVSPDGKTLCACSEYWLPEGVDNAMELLYREEAPYGIDSDNDIPDDEGIDEETAEAVSAMGYSVEARFQVAQALSRLAHSSSHMNERGSARSPSFREGPDGHFIFPRTPPVHASSADDLTPMTPPHYEARDQGPGRLSPPPPPGRRFIVGSTSRRPGEPLRPAPPPAPPQAPANTTVRQPHPLSVVSKSGLYEEVRGRYVPHVVTVSLDTDPIPEEVDPKLPRGKPYGAVPYHYRPRLGQLLEACPLDASKASAVTCVKFSPSTDFCLIGYGVREPLIEGGGNFHPVTALYRVRGGMTHVSTMLSGDDDVNIARFHPDSGYGFVYGTKQGRVRVLSPRPWNYYNT